MITFYERSLVFGIKLVQTNNAVKIRPHNQKMTLFSDWFNLCTNSTLRRFYIVILFRYLVKYPNYTHKTPIINH